MSFSEPDEEDDSDRGGDGSCAPITGRSTPEPPVSERTLAIVKISCNGVLQTRKWRLVEQPVLSLRMKRGTDEENDRNPSPFSSLVLKFSLQVITPHGQPFPCTAFGVQCRFQDDSAVHYLGAFGGPLTESVMRVKSVEVMNGLLNIEVRSFGPRCEIAPTPAEILLSDIVLIVLENDECMGSVSVDFLLSRVSGLPVFEAAMQRFGKVKPFSRFLKCFHRFHEKWVVFRYTPSELECFPILYDDRCNTRVAMNEIYRRTLYLPNDVARVKLRKRAFQELATLLPRLENYANSAEDLRVQVGSTRSYKTLREIHLENIV